MRPSYLPPQRALNLVTCAFLLGLCGCTTPPSTVQVQAWAPIPSELLEPPPQPVLLEQPQK